MVHAVIFLLEIDFEELSVIGVKSGFKFRILVFVSKAVHLKRSSFSPFQVVVDQPYVDKEAGGSEMEQLPEHSVTMLAENHAPIYVVLDSQVENANRAPCTFLEQTK
ncbi:hypothetical protein FNYG_12323 [Fusarium nygamai]|uniref:Uncharacterized protein n=1 Tax=Gibberella nygamai TaxID=42673 RepID=A0A2K0VW72_GIBNY|nr:hypothetical protein FNYG_12323 [Fusarium nygamai]